MWIEPYDIGYDVGQKNLNSETQSKSVMCDKEGSERHEWACALKS